jgi:hypothetical protein
MHMSRRSAFYGFIAAATATVVSALVYMSATSNLAALLSVGEGTDQDLQSAVHTRDLSLLLLFVTAVLTVILLIYFITLRRRGDRPVSA